MRPSDIARLPALRQKQTVLETGLPLFALQTAAKPSSSSSPAACALN